MAVLHVETVQEGQRPKWIFIKTGPNKYVQPQKEGYTFIGWKYEGRDEIIKPPFDDANNPFEEIDENTNIYAVWEEISVVEDTYTLANVGLKSFNVSEQEQVIDTIEVLSTKNGLPYDAFIVSTKDSVSWLELKEIIHVSGSRYLIKIIVHELPKELHKSGRTSDIIISQVDGEHITIPVTQNYEGSEEEIEEPDVEGYCVPNTENTTGETSLKVRLFGNAYGSFYPFTEIQKPSWQEYFELYYMCGGSVFAYFDKNNTGGIVFADSINRKYISLIDDDYGILFNLSIMNLWNGDGTDFGTYTKLNITTRNKPSLSIKIDLGHRANNFDEIHRMLLEGMLENKAIRIPCDGISSSTQIVKYPYTFEMDYFFQKPKITYISTEKEEVVEYVNIESSSFDLKGLTGELTDGEFSIKDKLIYNIGPNKTCMYKHYMLYFNSVFLDARYKRDDGTLNGNFGTCLHFIQEYNVKNRIYYGWHTNDQYFDDMYRETHSNNYSFHAWFEVCSSKILKENQWAYSTGNILEYVAYPNKDFDYSIRFNGEHAILNNNYMWGSKSYTVCSIINSTITFTKK